MNSVKIVAPSLLSADFSCMGEGVEAINKSGAQWVHLDIMDGCFVPVITFGPQMVKDIRPLTDKPFDVHLMVEHPENHIEGFVQAGADYLTVHMESSVHIHRLLTRIRELGCRPGISIVPSTPVSLLKEILPLVELVLVMTVNPGFGGQTMIPQCLEKVKELRRIREEEKGEWLISIDGGVNESTLAQVKEASPDVMVAGSAFFKAADRVEFVKKLM